MRLTSETELADQFGLKADKVAELRKKQQWPHVRLTRFDVRYTDAQIEQIIAMRTVTAPKPGKAVQVAGQTSRSAARAS